MTDRYAAEGVDGAGVWLSAICASWLCQCPYTCTNIIVPSSVPACIAVAGTHLLQLLIPSHHFCTLHIQLGPHLG